jgi:circadian clock protein KaiC
VTTFLVAAQHGIVGGNMSAPVDTTYLADTVILLRFFEHAGRVRKAISVVKNRSGPHEESIRELRMGKDGISLSEPLTRFRGILTGVPVEIETQP